MDEHAVLDVIAREKDVDGFHPLNIGAQLNSFGCLLSLSSHWQLLIDSQRYWLTLYPFYLVLLPLRLLSNRKIGSQGA
jgi:hypothetical protein